MNARSRQQIFSFIELTLGAVIAAFSIEEFLVPNRIFDGGVTGISMIVAHFIPVPLGVLIFCINLPFMWHVYHYFRSIRNHRAAYQICKYT